MKATHEEFHSGFRLAGQSFASVTALLKAVENTVSFDFLSEWFDEKPTISAQTSGSTGVPKQISLQKKHLRASALATGAFFDLPEGTTALLCLSPAYIAGKMMWVRALVLGWHIDLVAPEGNPLKDSVKIYDFTAMVPLQLANSINELHKIKQLIVGGGVVSSKLIQQIQGVSTQLYATYGMTETVSHVAIRKLNNPEEESAYKAMQGVSFSQDNRDCLVVTAPHVTADICVTNDVVRLVSETAFEWMGRVDTVINSGGVKLIPEEIEKKLSEIISQRFFVAGVPDSLLGEKLVLLIEGTVSNDVSDNVKSLKTLSKFEIPKEIYFIKKFIETETKKIQRKKTLALK